MRRTCQICGTNERMGGIVQCRSGTHVWVDYLVSDMAKFRGLKSADATARTNQDLKTVLKTSSETEGETQ